jgi:hypothetical protein
VWRLYVELKKEISGSPVKWTSWAPKVTSLAAAELILLIINHIFLKENKHD